MKVEQVLTLEKQLKRIANLALCMQGLWVVMLACLFFLLPEFYQKGGQVLSAVALLLSFAISRLYIAKGKELETIKKFSPKEIEIKKREYFTVFFSPYPLWVFMFIYFSK